MQIAWSDLTLSPDAIDATNLLETWRWLVEPSMQPMVVSAMGDLFLRTLEGKVYWLNTIDGQLSLAADSVAEFRENMTKPEYRDEWFLTSMIGQLKEAGVQREPSQVYAFKRPPILGGEMEVENVVVSDLLSHARFMGQLHEQIKDLPEGTDLSEIQVEYSEE